MKRKLTTYKFLLLPTTAQKTTIKKSIDCARYIYNQLKSTKEAAFNSYGVSFSKQDLQALIPSIKTSKAFLKNIHSQVAQDVNVRLDHAFQKFIREGAGYPKWAKKGKYNSITFPQTCFIVDEGILKLPQLKKVRFKDTARLSAGTKVRQVTIKYAYELDKYYACICCEQEFDRLPVNKNQIGIDIGVACFAASSEGEIVENPKYYTSAMGKLKRIQQTFARQEKGGENWKKTKKKIQKLHRKTANQRKDFLHKASTRLINENQVIVHEDLKMRNITKSAKGNLEKPGKNVSQKSGLNRSMLDLGAYAFFQMLHYKADRYGRQVIKVNPAYTSRTCSKCSNVSKTKKSSRVSRDLFICEKCNHEIHADINAALNILEKGISQGGHPCGR